MKKTITLLTLLFSTVLLAQIRGKVTTASGQALPYASVLIENTYNGTSTNDSGMYELNVKEKGKYTIIFQCLGFKTKKATVTVSDFPYTIENIALEDENFTLNEVVINNKENPAYPIIRNAIASRKKNMAKTDKFEADFYSRGIFRVKDMPKKILGQEVGDFNGSVDSTGTGIIYLSETVSKVAFEKPNKLREEIIASKISGNDNGFSYNTARGTHYDFYENYVSLGINMVSPIANNALNYYKYTLESTFFDNYNHLINKIKVTPKRDKEPVFEGYIYIVEDSWAIYAVDFDIKGYRMQQPVIETMKLTQSFTYNTHSAIWAKNIQTMDFSAGFFGVKFTGKFTHVFSNYIFKDQFEKKTFSNEIVTIQKEANKKDNDYWNTFRPVPLTEEEVTDYKKKDSIQTLRTSKVYLDSIDAKKNKFRPSDILLGYTHRNSFKKETYNYDGILDITSLGFNTVQGWNLGSGFSYRKWDQETGKSTYIGTKLNYGFAEDRLRITGSFTHHFNATNYAVLDISGGSSIEQFNPENPISNLLNSVTTLFFKNNFAKYYNKEAIRISYGQEVVNGVTLTGKVEYSARKPLFNNTDYVLLKRDKDYTSNNPLLPADNTVAPFEKHNLVKASLSTRIRFGQKYITRPDRKINIPNDKYPSLLLTYEKAFAGSADNYNYDLLSGAVNYGKTLGNKGDLGIRLKAGKFFNADNISFIDYKHFNGNQTHIGTTDRYLNVFNLLPYYSNSTNDAYLETHIEHNFNGYIMNKIPLLNKLQWNLIVGFHQINTPTTKPYQEFTAGFDNIGWGKFRMLRVDYVRSYQNGFQTDGIVFGLKFLNIID